MDDDLEERIEKYKSRIKGVRRKGFFIGDKGGARIVSRKIDEQVLSNTQTRSLMYLLGYEDKTYNRDGDGYSGISSNVFNKKIKPLIPEEAKVDPNEQGIPITSKRKDPTLYKKSGVETTLEKLSPDFLFYNEERFEKALEAVVLK